MICPHCLKTIDDGLDFCPSCNAYVRDDREPSRSEFVFCEGCGARLSSYDRTCPKCGRPAPGILSTSSASADLAAGKTASFPRLTQRMIDDAGSIPSVRASEVAVESLDPSSTNVLSAEQLAQADDRAPKRPAEVDGEDPYHKKKRRWPKVLAAFITVIALACGTTYFIVADPMGVMPGFYHDFKQAASEMFPMRQQAEDPASVPDGDEGTSSKDDAELTEAQAYQRLLASYNAIVAQHDGLDQIIDDYNGGYARKDFQARKDASAGAYASRTTLDKIIEEIKGLKLAQGSQYAQTVENLVQLATWVRTRVDIYCASWDISLSYTTESPATPAAETSILAPLRERKSEDQEAQSNYYANYKAFMPAEPAQ